MSHNQQRRFDLDQLDANVREMERLGLLNQGLDWEDDATDPMEKKMVTKDKPFHAPRGRGGRGNRRGSFRGQFQKRGRGGPKQKKNSGSISGSEDSSSYYSANSRYGGYHSPRAGSFYDSDSDNLSHFTSISQRQSSFPSDRQSSFPYERQSSFPYERQSPFPSDRQSPFPYERQSSFPSERQSSFPSDRQSSFSSPRRSSFPYEKLTPADLAKHLAEFDSFQATLLQLLDRFHIDHKLAERVARENGHTFEVEAELIRLRPDVKICSNYLNDGCTNREKCQDFHLCYKYVFGQCSQRDCSFGHFWLTDHNKRVSHYYNLNILTLKQLSGLFKNYTLPKAKSGELRVCDNYNKNECKNDDCPQLHVCLKYLAKQCSVNDCKLSHNLVDDNSSAVLRSHGLSMNESPRDILLTIVNIPTIKESIDSLVLNAPSNSETSSESGNTDTQKSELSKGDKVVKEIKDKTDDSAKEVVPLKTVWSNELIGETTLNEICFDSVEGFCSFEERGCWRLHCPLHFHWQVKATLGKKKCWVNLTEEQVLVLEKGFCDPTVTKIGLPALDPIKFKSEKGLLLILKGKSKWEANFDQMELILSGKNEVLELRRLCTEDTQNDIPAPCVWKWFFSDKNKNWIEYGDLDSTGEEQLKCDIDSKGIEKHFQTRSKSPLSFKNQSFSYLLDLQNMVQTNLSTNAPRKVRRRPAPHLKDETGDQAKSDLPLEWEPMQGEEKCKRVTLAPSSEEYKKINNHVTSNAQNNTYNILKIERVQNPYIYRAFQNKVQEMKATYKNDSTVNVRQLFHGTGPDIVPRVCDENFDWRLHGSSTGQAYGRGTYFSSLSSYSYGYARADPNGHRFMFIARVAVGTMTTGNPGMTRPPINTQYNIPFDSTVENMVNPTIIVKYDKQEYYPQYIITFG